MVDSVKSAISRMETVKMRRADAAGYANISNCAKAERQNR